MSKGKTSDKEISEFLDSHLEKSHTRPFLFVGSGFSRRYLGLETWADLLRRFSGAVDDFEYYLSASDSQLPKAAGLLSRDFSEYWWKSPDTQREREKYRAIAIRSSSPIKIAISEYINDISDFDLSESNYKEELTILSGLSVDGIITTNWDLLLESLFPSYRVFIGQQSIVTQVPHNIGEIYKIHGCCSDPNSLVLTQEDYDEFESKQAYLAAKLITIFVEHPIVFLGYSVSDPNIISLLRAIIRGLGQAELEKIRDNLIFVQRSTATRSTGIKETVLVVEDLQLPVTQIISDSFESIFTSIGKLKRKLPASVLRFCKEQLYRIAHDSRPSEKLCLIDYEDIDEHQDIEFVVGIGVAQKQIGQQKILAERGYKPVDANDLFREILSEENSLDPHLVLSETFTQIPLDRRHLPVFYFLKKTGNDTEQKYKNSDYSVDPLVKKRIQDFRTNGYLNGYQRDCKELSTSQIIEKFPPDKVTLMIPYQSPNEIDTKSLRDFLVSHLDRFTEGNYTSFYRKLACLYDKLVHGWK